MFASPGLLLLIPVCCLSHCSSLNPNWAFGTQKQLRKSTNSNCVHLEHMLWPGAVPGGRKAEMHPSDPWSWPVASMAYLLPHPVLLSGGSLRTGTLISQRFPLAQSLAQGSDEQKSRSFGPAF